MLKNDDRHDGRFWSFSEAFASDKRRIRDNRSLQLPNDHKFLAKVPCSSEWLEARCLINGHV